MAVYPTLHAGPTLTFSVCAANNDVSLTYSSSCFAVPDEGIDLKKQTSRQQYKRKKLLLQHNMRVCATTIDRSGLAADYPMHALHACG